MKKFIIAAALTLVTGVLASKTKNSSIPAAQPAITKSTLSADSKELASGD